MALSVGKMDTKKLLNALEWRYATKFFDLAKKIPADAWQTLERALVLTPTSFGLQPYKFLVINDPARRAALLPHTWNQRQVVDASHYVVFTARTKITESDVDKLIRRISEVRNVPVETLNGYRDIMVGDVVNGARGKIAHEWATRQTYIALGNLMTSAAVLGIDTCPIEGFVPAEYDRLLHLKDSGYASVVCCALGYRSSEDKYAKLPKVRFAAEALIQKI
ncbi:MAG TPA: NAD(P)H-dependent oxidoreductase [Verrucomicrobiae bacterium]|nr:NAD(P)H-dependent oxidoreductase [Verrucomicrobiae bacterium]